MERQKSEDAGNNNCLNVLADLQCLSECRFYYNENTHFESYQLGNLV